MSLSRSSKPPTPRIELALAMLALVGCTRPDPTPFLGAWAASGTGTVELGAAADRQTFRKTSASPLAGYRISFERDESGLRSTDSFGCRLRWELDDHVAKLRDEQSCVVRTRRSGATLTFDSGSLTLRPLEPGRLSATGTLSGEIEEGGALLGNARAATATLDVVLTRSDVASPR